MPQFHLKKTEGSNCSSSIFLTSTFFESPEKRKTDVKCSRFVHDFVDRIENSGHTFFYRSCFGSRTLHNSHSTELSTTNKLESKMAEGISKRQKFCFLLQKETVISFVIAGIFIHPNGQCHLAAAASRGGFDGNSYLNGEPNPYRRYNYRAEMEEMYSPYNPLWREEQIYTGERRGPVTDPSSLRRPRRLQRANTPSYSPLAPSIQDIDDVSSRSSYSDFPLQSADIGSAGNRRNAIDPGYSDEPRERRIPSFPIEFRRKRGRVNIGHSNEDRPSHRLLSSEVVSPKSDFSPDAKGSKRVFPYGSKGGAQKLSNHTAVQVHGDKTRDGQVSVSLDPFALATLLQNTVTGVVGITSVYVGTLKLLGPMILAKHCLTTVGGVINNRYNGRLGRKASIERLSYSEKEIPKEQNDNGLARALGRTLLQIICMSSAGRMVGLVLDQTPCLLQPSWICQWWYGVVWLASVYAIGSLCQEWVSGKSIHPWLSITPTWGTRNFDSRISTVDIQGGRRDIARPLFRFFQKMSQNPEEWINGLFRRVPRWQIRQNYQRNREMTTDVDSIEDIKLDPLLFPSTWKPFSVLMFLALSRAICRSFCGTASPSEVLGTLGDALCTENKQYLIMRSFIIQQALYSEWHRVFVQERRVALGAGISMAGLLALLWSVYSVATVDSIAAMALFPIVMARMVGTWINILMSYNHIDLSSETISWRDFASRLNI